MIKLYKTIQLEPFKARVPANVPPCDKSLICDFENNFNGDYGMIPSALHITEFDVMTQTDFHLNITDDTKGGYYNIQPLSDCYLMQEFHTQEHEYCYYVKEDTYSGLTQDLYGRDEVMLNACSQYEEFDTFLSGVTYQYTCFNIYKHKTEDATDVSNDTIEVYAKYKTLHNWFLWIKDYFAQLEVDTNRFNKIFVSAVEKFMYYESQRITTDFSLQTAIEMDEKFLMLGGYKFAEWLFHKVFGVYWVRLAKPYEDYETQVPHYMYVSQIRSWKAWFDVRYPLYKDVTWDECKHTEDCCECELYLRKGGNRMYDWLQQFKDDDKIEFDCLDTTMNVDLHLNNQIETLGEMTPIVGEWSREEVFKSAYITDGSGAVIVYDGDSFILKPNVDGYQFSERFKEFIFGNLNPDAWNETDWLYEYFPKEQWEWESTFDYWAYVSDEDRKARLDAYWEHTVDPNYTINPSYQVITGKTTSQLVNFKDTIVSMDDTNQEMPGQFVYEDDNVDIMFPQPTEGTLFDLYYHAGNVFNLTKIKEVVGSSPFILYDGDILKHMRFFLSYTDGSEVQLKQGVDPKTLYGGTMGVYDENGYYNTKNYGNLPQLRRMSAELDFIFDKVKFWNVDNKDGAFTDVEDNFNSIFDIDPNKQLNNRIYVEFVYEVGGVVEYDYKIDGNGLSYDTMYKPIHLGDDNYPYSYETAITYKEVAYLRPDTFFYMLDDGTSIVCRYFELRFNNEKVDSVDLTGEEYTEQTAEFSYLPYVGVDNNNGDCVYLPLYRREDSLRLDLHAIFRGDLFIDRGKVQVLEKQLKLQEVDSVESLEQYGNGYFIMSE